MSRNDLFCYAWEDTSVLLKCKHGASMDLPKLLVLTCSCLAGPLVGMGRYGWRCSLMECLCVVSLIAVGSFTLFTVGCGCIVNLVLCLLCGWIFHCVLRGTARHLYRWSGFFYFYDVQFLLYRGHTVLYALCMRLLVLSVWWCILRCCVLPLLLRTELQNSSMLFTGSF